MPKDGRTSRIFGDGFTANDWGYRNEMGEDNKVFASRRRLFEEHVGRNDDYSSVLGKRVPTFSLMREDIVLHVLPEGGGSHAITNIMLHPTTARQGLGREASHLLCRQ